MQFLEKFSIIPTNHITVAKLKEQSVKIGTLMIISNCKIYLHCSEDYRLAHNLVI